MTEKLRDGITDEEIRIAQSAGSFLAFFRALGDVLPALEDLQSNPGRIMAARINLKDAQNKLAEAEAAYHSAEKAHRAKLERAETDHLNRAGALMSDVAAARAELDGLQAQLEEARGVIAEAAELKEKRRAEAQRVLAAG